VVNHHIEMLNGMWETAPSLLSKERTVGCESIPWNASIGP